MTRFVAAQLHSLAEGLRLLAAVASVPVDLQADIRVICQAVSSLEGVDLPVYDAHQSSFAYRRLVDDPATLVSPTIEQLGSTLTLLENLSHTPLPLDWVARVKVVLDNVRQRVSSELRSKTVAGVSGLYVIVDPETTRGRPVTDIAEAALRGGSSVIQLRDKERDKGSVLPTARRLADMCREHNATFIVNDDPSLAVSSGADGLHVGQADLPVPEVRQILELRQFVGRSHNSMEEIAESESLAVDYVAIGTVFPTATMGKAGRKPVGVEMVAKVKESTMKPVVAIGGINRENIAEVVAAGADCVCVASAVTMAEDPQEASSRLADAMKTSKS